ncbi:hypothetical protein LMG27177_03844 [Paraburkholderia fynbosensis]|uniref:Glycosyltransferase 2-like domain-containing protein n=1 Tax=Paraburkholderia fynbosensis TaxID=1200993 RepID=A0A6J5GES9_9BURK|nr:hypothetical protein LMG27177_03844 [Paraburkholderia fynbosensis]
MLGVVIPAHNAADYMARACARSSRPHGILRSLANRSESLWSSIAVLTQPVTLPAHSTHMSYLSRPATSVSRATGAAAALAERARWLAFTDADTTVAPDWLVQQLLCRADAVCGVISVTDWRGHSDAVRENFVTTYRDADGHRHIHSANLGVSASAYSLVKGFQPLATNEDVALVEALIAAGATVAWSAAPRVTTSARLDSRAPGGFGDALRQVSRRLAAKTLSATARLFT